MGQFDEAESLLLGSFPWICDDRGLCHRETRITLGRLVSLYERWGKTEEVKKWAALLETAGADP
jgi:hypothetical protein